MHTLCSLRQKAEVNVTHVVNISLSYTSSQELLVTAQTVDREVEAYATLSDESDDLISELQGGRATQRAINQSQSMVSDVLFAGKVGELLRDILSNTPSVSRSNSKSPNDAHPLRALLILSAPDALHHWPWELLTAPQATRPLLLDHVELIRAIGPTLTSTDRARLKIQLNGRVVTKSREMFKFSAMRAATAHISRRHKVKVEVTHDHQSMISPDHDKLLFHHLYAVDRQGAITLESSANAPLYVGESTFARDSYLLNITPRVSSSVVKSAKNAGALAVIARQFDQSVKTRAESDRAIYHALGSGSSLADALQWARQALFQSDMSGYQWAALTLTTSSVDGGTPLALSDFPPRITRPSAVRSSTRQESSATASSSPEASAPPSAGTSTSKEIQEGSLTLVRGRRPLPDSAAQFVRDTVALIQKSQRSHDTQDQLSLALRTPVMRHLSGLVHARKIKANPNLQRSAQLSQQLIEASIDVERRLTLPPQWLGRCERLANALGVQIDSVAQGARSLITSPALWVWGSDPQTRLSFARGLCEEVFQSFPYEPIHPHVELGVVSKAHSESTQDQQRREPVASKATRRIITGLAVASQLTWSEHSSSQSTSSPDVASSSGDLNADGRPLCQLTVGYQSERNAWRPYERAWVIIDNAEDLDLAHRRQASLALRCGEVVGHLSDQSIPCTPHHLQLSRNTRIIYLSDQPPSQLDDSEVVVSLEPNIDQLPHLWRQALRVELNQQQRDSAWIEEHLSSPLTQSFMQILCLALELELISVTRAYDALCYGVTVGADAVSFVEAAELYIAPLAQIHGALKRDCLFAFAMLDQESYEIFWREIFAERAMVELPLVSLSFKG